MTKEEIEKYLRSLSASELDYAKARYCGPSNTIIAEKKFGRTIDRLMEQEIEERIVFCLDTLPDVE